MEMQTVLEAADAIKRLKMYPYFDVAHYILNCMAVREDTYPQQPTGTRSVRVMCAWHTSNAISNSAVNNLTLCLYSLPHGYYWKSTRKLKTNTKECGYINRNFHKSVKAVWWFISIVDCYYKFIFNRLTSYQARLHTMVEYNESAQPNSITRTDSKGTCWKMNCRRKL